MDLTNRYPTDKTKIDEGVEIKIDETSFILTYYNSSKVQLYNTQAIRKLKLSGLDDQEILLAATRDTLTNVVILGWSNLKEDGVEIPYSKEECKRLLEEYDGMATELMSFALNIATFRREEKIETMGKSETS